MKLKRHNLLKIAIVGRPNVGKSTLFNRIVKRRKSIVEKLGPTTRDRIAEIVKYNQTSFELIDTGGMHLDKTLPLSHLIERQVLLAVKEADRVLFVCDVKNGILPLDREICELLRKSGKETVLVINKVDNQSLLSELTEFYGLGIGDPVPVSSLHDKGIAELLDIITKDSSAEGHRPSRQDSTLRLSVVGKPNAGKSSFVNALAGEERIIVSEEPGTTRDSVDTHFEEDRRSFIITDTAGIRSKSKINDPIIYFSVVRTKESMEKSDGCIILLDGMVGVGKEDFKIIDMAQRLHKVFVIAVNKWDLCVKEGVNTKDYEKAVRQSLRFIHGAPILFVSALTGKDILKTVNKAAELVEISRKSFSTSRLNEILKGLTIKSTKVYSVRQIKYRVPKLEVIVKKPESIDRSTKKYTENRFREALGLQGIPVEIVFRKKKFS
jgi:GTP-binding protein